MSIKYNLSAQPKRERKQSSYDPKKIFIEKAGKKINVYDAIQEAAVDCDIYKTLEKYGSIDSMYKYDTTVFAEFDKLMSLKDVLEIQKQANHLWLQLPAGVREQFHNNPEELIKNGQEWLEKEIAKKQAASGTTSGTTENNNTKKQAASGTTSGTTENNNTGVEK